MFSFLRELIAVPIRILLWLTNMVPVVNPVAISKLLWETSGLVEDGEIFLKHLIDTQGIEDGRQAADAMFAHTNDARFMAVIAYTEYAAGNIDAAQQWVDLAHKQGSWNPERLLLVEFLIANSRRDNIKMREYAQMMYDRNDLPMEYSAIAHPLKAYTLLKDGNFTESAQTAKRILSIREDIHARLVQWAVNVKAGREQEAQRDIQIARASWKGKFFSAILADYCLIIGDQQGAMKNLNEAQKEGFDPNWDPDMASLSATQEFQEFKAKEL